MKSLLPTANKTLIDTERAHILSGSSKLYLRVKKYFYEIIYFAGQVIVHVINVYYAK